MKVSRLTIGISVLQLLTIAVFFFLTKNYVESLRFIRLTQWFGFSAAITLYVYLVVKSLKPQYCAYLVPPLIIFMCLHSGIGFFGEIGGFEVLPFIPHAFFVGILVGFVAFVGVLTTQAILLYKKIPSVIQKGLDVSFELFGLVSIIHILIVGSHYLHYTSTVMRITIVFVSLLVLLKVFLFDRFVSRKLSIQFVPFFTILTTFVIGAVVSRIISSSPNQLLPTINMHAETMTDMQMDMSGPHSTNTMMVLMNALPSMKGDRTKRYTVSFLHPDNIRAGTETTLQFKVFDAASGKSVGLFQQVYTKLTHVVIVDQDLNYFSHEHAEQNGETFELKTKLPKDGMYHIYLSFQPIGAIEQQFGFTFLVGSESKQTKTWQADAALTKTFEQAIVSLSSDQLFASKLMKGEQALTFTLKDPKTQTPLTNLYPYLAAYGHLVMINTKTYEYLHVHPTNVSAPDLEERGGPQVEFVPMSIFDPIHPGTYRLFGQFSPNGQLFTADFTIQIQ